MVGFFLTVYVMIPVAYWSNAYEAKRFPSAKTFDFTGHTYNITRVLNQETFDLHEAAYNGYSKLYLSVFFAFTYGLSFATLAAAISHVGLFHGKTIMRMWKGTAVALQKQMGDVHTRIMKRNYEEVPSWWFYTILAVTLALSLITCEGFGRQLQLPWWGILLACAMALFFTLPIGIITATTNQVFIKSTYFLNFLM
ncbi:hypothetical protein CsSME_00018060 [Camellia sinensis var. sinensis]